MELATNCFTTFIGATPVAFISYAAILYQPVRKVIRMSESF